MELGLHCLEGLLGGRLIAGRDGGLELLDEGANSAHARTVSRRAACVVPDAFLGGLVMRHFFQPAILIPGSAALIAVHLWAVKVSRGLCVRCKSGNSKCSTAVLASKPAVERIW